MCLARLLPWSLCPLLLATVASGQARIWTVDDDGPADFTDIQPAIDAASDGDSILVEAGTYGGFTLDAKGLSIVGEPSATLVPETVEIRNLAAGQVAVLSNLSVSIYVSPIHQSPTEALIAESNLGSVRVQSCSFEGGRSSYDTWGSFLYPRTGAKLHLCGDVFLVACQLRGGRGGTGYYPETCDGAPGCIIQGSSVALYDCQVEGGRGGPSPQRDAPAADGGAGADVNQSFLFLSNTMIAGGDGGDNGYDDGFGSPGDGGPGFDLNSLPSELQILQCVIRGGYGGFNSYMYWYGNDGPPLAGHHNSLIVDLPGTRRKMTLSAHRQVEGSTVTGTFLGVGGDRVYLLVDRGTDFTFEVGAKGTWVLPQPPTFPPTPIAVIPAGGQIQVEIPSASPTGGNEAEVEFRQMYVVSATGERILGSPTGTVQTACPGPTTYCVGAPNSVGSGALISWTGSASVDTNDAVLHAAQVPPSQFGLFYYGPNQIQLPWGDGFRCVGGGVYRLGTVLSDGSGNAVDPLDYTQPPMSSGNGMVVAGGSWSFQYWYRDPNGPGGSGFNASNALAVAFCP